MNLKFIILLFTCLLLIATCNGEESNEFEQVEEVEQTIEITVDNDPVHHVEEKNIMNNIEEEAIERILDCDVFSSNGTCLENFNDLEALNTIENIFKYFNQFLSCKTKLCVEEQKENLKERLDIGDPIAQYTYSIFIKFGLYSYPIDRTESLLHLEAAAEGGNILAQLSKGTRYQIGDDRDANVTLTMETILPAWRLLYAKKLSLFDALYEKKQVEWPTDVTGMNYDVMDYIDVLKNQMSEKDFRNTKKSLLLSKKSRNLKELAEIYRGNPSELHFLGFQYLEGVDCERNYTRAFEYFDNSTQPLHNTTFHVFGRGIMQFYGLGMEKNIPAGCASIAEAAGMEQNLPVMTYYNALCSLKQHKFAEAKERLLSATFAQFAPALDLSLRIKESRIGSKVQIDFSNFYGHVFQSRVREYFLCIPEKMREGAVAGDIDQLLLYGLIGFDVSIPYWGSHLINVYEKKIWKGAQPRFAFRSEMHMNQIYRTLMEYLLSISPANNHAVDVALNYLEGKHGYPQNMELGKKILQTSKADEARFYLGVLHHWNEDSVELTKMNLDAAVQSGSYTYAAMYYRFRLLGECIWTQIKRGEWETALTTLWKVLILNQSDLVYDEQCRIITEVRTGLDKQAIVDWAEKIMEQIGEDEEVRKLIDEVKEKIQKEKEKEAKHVE